MMAGPALAALVAAAIFVPGCRRTPDPPQGPTPATAAEADTLADFKRRLDEYATLHKRIEDRQPKLPTDATPAQIDSSQRTLGQAISAERVNARQGDLFTPAMGALIRQHFTRIFRGPDGPALKASVMDENPVGIKVSANQRYPDQVPMSTMPPAVLKILPKMPEELEYRFIGRALIIMDVHAHLIVDFLPDAIPG